MTELNLEELAQLAKKATPSPWRCCGSTLAQGKVYGVVGPPDDDEILGAVDGVMVAECWKESDAAFVAAANPQVVLKLIETIRKLEAERKRTVRLTLEQARHLSWGFDGDGQVICKTCYAPRADGHFEDCWITAKIKEAEGE